MNTGRHRAPVTLRSLFREPLAWQAFGYLLTGMAGAVLIGTTDITAVRILSCLILLGLGFQWWALRPVLAAWAETRWDEEEAAQDARAQA